MSKPIPTKAGETISLNSPDDDSVHWQVSQADLDMIDRRLAESRSAKAKRFDAAAFRIMKSSIH